MRSTHWQTPYQAHPWPTVRNALTDFLELHRKHSVWGFTEIDVTEAMLRIRSYQRILRMGISFHAFVIYCMAKAIAEHRQVQAYRRGDRLIVFDEVDVSTAVEKRLPNHVKIPVGYVFRAADRRSLAQINWELRQAMKSDLTDDKHVRQRRWLAKLPWLVRRIFWWYVQSNPFLLKAQRGTVGLTNLQAPGFKQPMFGLPPNIYTLTLAIGSVYQRREIDEQGQLVTRKILCLSGAVDHAIVDGRETASFIQRFAELLEAADGLDQEFISEMKNLIKEKSDHARKKIS